MIKGRNPTYAREVALQVLIHCKRRGAWSDSALSSGIHTAELSDRDAALASRLCYGVQQNQALLEYWLEQVCSVPLVKLEDPVLIAMELGAYQIAFSQRIPARAAVNESVELARRWAKNPNSPRLVNAVLRSFARERDAMPQPEQLCVRYSHPQWLVQLFDQELEGQGIEELLKANNTPPSTVIQTNTLKTNPEDLQTRLEQEGVQIIRHPSLPGCMQISGTGNLERLPSFRDGWFQIQDSGAHMAVLAADPKPGMKVLDACAAPGGKSFSAAIIMNNQGSILACDLQEKKLGRISSGANRLGISCIQTQAMDARRFDPSLAGQFDLVLTDVPCSGLGIIRKKPDIRYKQPEPLMALPGIQLEILSNASRYVRPGGVLLYSTCTVLRRENQEVIQAFLERQTGFRLEAFSLPGVGDCEGMLTLWPHIHNTDGFFIAKLRRNDD